MWLVTHATHLGRAAFFCLLGAGDRLSPLAVVPTLVRRLALHASPDSDEQSRHSVSPCALRI